MVLKIFLRISQSDQHKVNNLLLELLTYVAVYEWAARIIRPACLHAITVLKRTENFTDTLCMKSLKFGNFIKIWINFQRILIVSFQKIKIFSASRKFLDDFLHHSSTLLFTCTIKEFFPLKIKKFIWELIF